MTEAAETAAMESLRPRYLMFIVVLPDASILAGRLKPKMRGR
jgi:hypothetical protein